jgi:hypothetical protein
MSSQYGLPRRRQTGSGQPPRSTEQLPPDFYLPGYIPPEPPPTYYEPGSTVQAYQPPMWLAPPKRRRGFLRVFRFAGKGRAAAASR